MEGGQEKDASEYPDEAGEHPVLSPPKAECETSEPEDKCNDDAKSLYFGRRHYLDSGILRDISVAIIDRDVDVEIASLVRSPIDSAGRWIDFEPGGIGRQGVR